MFDTIKHISSKTHLDIVSFVQTNNLLTLSGIVNRTPTHSGEVYVRTVVLVRCYYRNIWWYFVGGFGGLGVGMLWIATYSFVPVLGRDSCPTITDIFDINAEDATRKAENRVIDKLSKVGTT